MDNMEGIKTKKRESSRCPANVKAWCMGVFIFCGIGLYALSTDSFHARIGAAVMSKAKHVLNNSIERVHAVLNRDDSYETTRALEWSPHMDILDERTALSDPVLTDIRKSVNIKNSKVYLLGNKTQYEVGDTVKIRVELFDGFGVGRHRGGDQLRVRIFEASLGASAAAYVVDHHNGSYTAMIRCLWAGTPTILVYMSYTREAVRALYHIRSNLTSTRDIWVRYRNEEGKLCHALTRKLNQSVKMCNMTSMNGQMSWYCEAPTSGNVLCTDVKYFFKHYPYPKRPVTAAEEQLFVRNGEHLSPVIKIIVKDHSSTPSKTRTKPPCTRFNRTQLWFQPSPIGHFIGNKWQTEHCTITTADRFPQCLRNRHILLYGDSTIRQWFVNLSRRYSCVLKTEPWHQEKWKKDSAAYCPKQNLTLEWIVHSLPGMVDNSRPTIHSIAGNMLTFAHRKNVIFVIHLLCHLTAVHHDVFRDRMTHISESIRKIVEINKDAIILIKGGHTFRDFREVSDYYGYVYRTIMIEEFKGLYDKVVYLDNKDMTVAREVKSNHPDKLVVNEMVNQMLSYVCD